MAYKEGCIKINNVPTNVRTWGGWVEDEIESDPIFLMIPGNPGITDFYTKFLATLQMLLNIPVWALNHAGHELPDESVGMVMPSVEENPSLYDLAGQYEHKRAFIKKYIPKSKKIILMGHSLGGKVCVELMKDREFAERVLQTYLMFPTLENIRKTNNAEIFNKYGHRIFPYAIKAEWIFRILPTFVTYYFFSGLNLLSFNYLDSCWIHGLIKLLNQSVTSNCIDLAVDEFKNINELDTEIYVNYKDKINIFYGQNDGWTEPNQYQNMKKRHPQIRAEMLDSKFHHTFTFHRAKEMAEFIADDFKKKK